MEIIFIVKKITLFHFNHKWIRTTSIPTSLRGVNRKHRKKQRLTVLKATKNIKIQLTVEESIILQMR